MVSNPPPAPVAAIVRVNASSSIGAIPPAAFGINTAVCGDPNEAAAWVDYADNTEKNGIKYREVGNGIPGNGEDRNTNQEDNYE